MADAIPVAIRKAVADVLTANHFGQAYDAEQSYADWDLTLEDSGKLHVDVVAGIEPDVELETRASVRYVAFCDIGVRKRFTVAAGGRIDIEEIDNLMLFCEEIYEHLWGEPRLTAFDRASLKAIQVRAGSLKDNLRDKNQFTVIIHTTWDVTADLA